MWQSLCDSCHIERKENATVYQTQTHTLLFGKKSCKSRLLKHAFLLINLCLQPPACTFVWASPHVSALSTSVSSPTKSWSMLVMEFKRWLSAQRTSTMLSLVCMQQPLSTVNLWNSWSGQGDGANSYWSTIHMIGYHQSCRQYVS